MKALVDRFGRTGAAAVTSLLWAVPMAAWAGSADLTPIDQTAYPKVALAIGVAMLIAWLFLVARIARQPVERRQRRFDLAQMSGTEKGWTLALFVFGAGLIAWLNAAATVDWAPLFDALRAGKLGPVVFGVGLAAFLVLMVAGVGFSWSRATRAYRRRSPGPPTP